MKYYVTYGRFNPPTKAHKQLIESMIQKSIDDSTEDEQIIPIIAFSSNEKGPKNPLTVAEKVTLVHSQLSPEYTGKAMILVEKDVISLGMKLSQLTRPWCDNVKPDITLFLGTDRIERKDGVYPVLKKYNGIEYHLNSIEYHEFPRTDEDISASKLRQAVKDNDKELYRELFYSSDQAFQNYYWDTLRERLT